MRRKIYNELVNWKNNKESKKPLLVLGARQVGKTFIIDSFCKDNFENYVYVNLLNDFKFLNLFNEKIDSEERFKKLKLLLGVDIECDNTILFVDEVQESEKFVSELKFMCENHNNVNIVCSGSLLGVKLKRDNSSFPVGKVKMLTLYPLDFEEFMLAVKEDDLIDEIKKCYKNNFPMGEALHSKCINYYRIYNITGGMPESIKNMLRVSLDIFKFDNSIIGEIIDSYFKDMDKYVINKNEIIKNERLYKSVPSQIANESSHFQFSKVKSGARIRDYDSSLNWLLASDIIYMSTLVSRPLIPLKGFEVQNTFKLFMSDIGLLNYSLGINHYDIMSDNISLFKGAIAENYVANQLVYNGVGLNFYKKDNSLEINFLLYNEDGIIPVEVKAALNVRSISLKKYIINYSPSYAIRVSPRDFGYDDVLKIKFVPLYAVFCIKE